MYYRKNDFQRYHQFYSIVYYHKISAKEKFKENATLQFVWLFYNIVAFIVYVMLTIFLYQSFLENVIRLVQISSFILTTFWPIFKILSKICHNMTIRVIASHNFETQNLYL